jgi:hypothetical protein
MTRTELLHVLEPGYHHKGIILEKRNISPTPYSRYSIARIGIIEYYNSEIRKVD